MTSIARLDLRPIMLGALLSALGCEGKSEGDEPGSSDDDDDDDDDDSSVPSVTETDTDASSSDADTSGGSFCFDLDLGACVLSCDPFAQDCPEGEKCVPYARIDLTPSGNICVPVLGDGLPGDPCTSEGILDGADSCGADSFCWDLEALVGPSAGTCTEFCGGNFDEPLCPAGMACVISNEGSVNACTALCDPLLQDCDAGEACDWTGDGFHCVANSDELATNEPCAFLHDCSPGNVCIAAEALPSCGASACCAVWCDLADPSCPVPGTACVPWFDGEAPPGYETLGACLSPP